MVKRAKLQLSALPKGFQRRSLEFLPACRVNHLVLQKALCTATEILAVIVLNHDPRSGWAFYRLFRVLPKDARMDVMAAAKAHNQRAVQQKWEHFCDPTLAFTQPRYGQLLNIWRARAGSRKMPTRSEMTARDLKDFLRDIVIFRRESTNPSRYTWRLIGTGLTDIVGHHTGQTFDESVPPEHLTRWIEVCDLILQSEQPLRLRGRVHIRGREYLDAENLYLPLANDNNEPAFILGFLRYTPHTTDDDNYWENELASIPGGLL